MADQVFVARERELTELQSFLNRALDGQGQVCFVTGEAGAGKTALLTEFARRVQDDHPDLIVAVGQGDARTGAGDPYLPFREVMGLLTGDVEAKLAQGAITRENAGRLRDFLRISGQALVDLGPDLIDIFVPGVGLATRAGTFLAGKAGWLPQLEDLTDRKNVAATDAALDQNSIFEQYTNVLRTLGAQQPMIVVLDDLQWADAASIELLFRLGRRIQTSRIMIIGAYRPHDVAVGRAGERHPLEPVLNEFKRYFGDIRIDLTEAQETAGREFVDALLDTEPNRLGDGFRQALFEHTGGYPLFTVELIRALQARGDLVLDDEGHWIHRSAPDWGALPARVEGVIEERIGQLEAELRDILTIASVEGEDFTAEVVARVHAADERGLIRQLSGGLEKQHKLVHAQGTLRLGGQRLSRFRFRHQLFQKYLYNKLNEVEQTYLHEDVGHVLEALYGDQAADIAVQLAWHFQKAGIDDKTFHYLKLAADRAARSYAYQEARDLYRQAIEAAQRLDLPGQEIADLYSAQGRVLEHAGRYQAAVDAYRELERLAQSRNDPAMEGVAISRLVTCYAEPTEMHSPELAKPLIERGLTLAQEMGDHDLESWLLWSATVWANHYGTGAEAQAAGEASIAIARQHGLHQRLAFVLNDLAINLRLSGNPEQAQAYAEEARTLFREMDNRPMLADNLGQQAWNDYHQLEFESAIQFTEQCIEISEAINNPWNLSLATMVRGQVHTARGEWGLALMDLEESILIGEKAGFIFALTFMPMELGRLLRDIGQLERAWSLHTEAHQVSKRRAPFLLRVIESELAMDALAMGQVDDGIRWLQVVREREPRGAIGTAWGVLDSPARAAVRAAEHTGDWSLARHSVEQAIDDAQRRRLPLYLPRLAYEHARCLEATGRVAEAEARYEEAITDAEDVGLRPVEWQAHAALSRLYAAQGRADEAGGKRTVATAIVNEIADTFADTYHRDSFLATPAVRAVHDS